MKTTIDITNSLFREAKRFISQKGQSLREVVEISLRLYLDSQYRQQKQFRWKHKPFQGHGLVEGMQEGDWEQVRKLIYEGHGG